MEDTIVKEKIAFKDLVWPEKQIYIDNERSKDFMLGSEKTVTFIFNAVDLPVESVWELPNMYWPPSYEELRAINPWWLVKTKYGLFEIGRRKRVVAIDWRHTLLRVDLLPDSNITSGLHYVHAWKDDQVFDYLRQISHLLNGHIISPKVAVST